MGHVGLMPQSISVLGGFRPHGQTATEAVRVLREAKVCAASIALRLHASPDMSGNPSSRQL